MANHQNTVISKSKRQSTGNETAGLFCGALFVEQGKTGKPVKQEPDSALIVAHFVIHVWNRLTTW